MSKFRKIFLIVFAVVFAVVMLLVACSNDTDETSGENSSTYTEAENSSEDGSLQEETSDTSGGDIQITVADVTSTATFYDTTINGLTVEIFAVLASDTTVRVAFNTCQVCNGSKKAYFVQSGKYMVCQNCGSKISVDTVGKSSNSCSPVPVSAYSIDDDVIIVSQSYLESKVSLFKKWKDN
ncbi:MAG: DUF2318 domain-containing protein [Clostridia bacterium]|nr:DUF2318 domain-containing protein [Clostridia bacterium]